jgi:hypothetical protein
MDSAGRGTPMNANHRLSLENIARAVTVIDPAFLNLARLGSG